MKKHAQKCSCNVSRFCRTQPIAISFGEFLPDVETTFVFEAFLTGDLSAFCFLQVNPLTVKNIYVTPSSMYLPLHLSWITCFTWTLVLTYCSIVMICCHIWVYAIIITCSLSKPVHYGYSYDMQASASKWSKVYASEMLKGYFMQCICLKLMMVKL